LQLFVKVLVGAATFEREITLDDNVGMLEKAARMLGAPRIADKLAIADIVGVDETLGKSVLNTAKRFGKARFAQKTFPRSRDTGLRAQSH